MKLKHFRPHEFTNAVPSCSIEDMSPLFLQKLDLARDLANVPYIINSAFRTVEHEKEQGRDGTSSHTKGLAVDLHCTGSQLRYRIIKGLIEAGFRRIIVYPTFIHVDMDKTKTNPVFITK